MGASRRDFLKKGAHTAAGAVFIYLAKGAIGGHPPTAARAEGEDAYDTYVPEDHDWVFIVDTTKCIGCGRCARACKSENNVPWEGEYNRTWIERYQLFADGHISVDSPDGGLNGFPEGQEFPVVSDGEPEPNEFTASHVHDEIEKTFFVPKLCNQCENPPCVQVCPVGATYQTADNVVLINQEKCIGCRYCIQACPYGARYLVPDGERTPFGQARVADKCTWCYHRITRGLLPACVEACPVGARLFGDRNDENDPVNEILAANALGALKPELGTRPRVKYLQLDEAVV